MTSTAVRTVENDTVRSPEGRLRRLALRATVLALVLATTVVSTAGMAWAGPELGC